ncbi:MAG TPA: tyrosine-type recombinase/integrase [Thermodesulfobacteriota bacterium]|nr:tyrosine-type recombinase/integrase [Thermodesulfobacteriota bacterium]
MASLQFKCNTYYGVFSVNGRKKWVKIGSVTKQEAQKILRQLELEFIRDKFNLTPPKTITLYEFIDKYMDYCKANKSELTVSREEWTMTLFKKFFRNIEISQISTESVEAYKLTRVRKKLKPKTINRELEIVRFMLNKAHEWGYIQTPPKIRLLKVQKRPPKLLTIEDINKLLEHANPWLKPMIIVILNSGVRVGELLSLKFSDIDFNNRTLTVIASKTGNFRVLPINEELYQIFLYLKDNYIDPNTLEVSVRKPEQLVYIFCKPDGSKLKSIRTSFNKCCRGVGVKATPYHLRHQFASYLIMNGADLVSVKELMGHTEISTTMIYAHLLPSYKSGMVEKLPWIKNPNSFKRE